jgi:hypothetical protein
VKGASKSTYMMFIVYYIIEAIYNFIWLYLNWKLYEAISTRRHDEADKFIQAIITIYVINLIIVIVFSLWMGVLGGAIPGLVIGIAIAALWVWYL